MSTLLPPGGRSRLRPINRDKYGNIPERQLPLEEMAFDGGMTSCNQVKKKGGLGYFHRVEINGDKIKCNCENFRRFGLCHKVQLLKIACQDVYPKDIMKRKWSSMKGFKEIGANILDKVVDSCLDKEELKCLERKGMSPPDHDPMKIDPKKVRSPIKTERW